MVIPGTYGRLVGTGSGAVGRLRELGAPVKCPLIRRVVLALAGVAFLGSCVSVRASRVEAAAPGSDTATVAVRVYDSVDDRDAGVLSRRRAVTELLRDERGWTRVHATDEPAWQLCELPRGRYRVQVERRVDETGREQRMASSDDVEFALGPGDKVLVEVVLKHPKRVLVSAGVGAGVVAVAVTVTLVILVRAMTAW